MSGALEFSNLRDLAQFKKRAACYELWFSSGSVYVGATQDLARRAYQHLQPIGMDSSMGAKFKAAVQSGDAVVRCVVWLFASDQAAQRCEERLLAAHLLRGSSLLNSTADGKGCGELLEKEAQRKIRSTNGRKGAEVSLSRTTAEQRSALAAHAGHFGGVAKWGSTTAEQRAVMMRKAIDARLAKETPEKRRAKLEKMWEAKREKTRARHEAERG